MDKPFAEINIRQEPFYLLLQKAIYRPIQKQLILSDLQNLSVDDKNTDLERLQLLIQLYKPETVILLGDLFDARQQADWEDFGKLFQKNKNTQFVLVESNQALLPRSTHTIENLIKVAMLEEKHIIFSHHPNQHPHKLNICGFLNPVIASKKRHRSGETLSCFVLDTEQLVLPAFGHKQNHLLYEKKWDTRFFITTDKTVEEII